jgi:ribonuclease VapC
VIVDTSALLAILLGEPEADAFTLAIGRAEEPVRMSAASYVEAGIRVDQSKNPIAQLALDDLIERLRIVIEPVSVEQAYAARVAYRAYGKGSGHPAGLNFGDCFAYALAKATGEPLLFKGGDFGHTDLRAAS